MQYGQVNLQHELSLILIVLLLLIVIIFAFAIYLGIHYKHVKITNSKIRSYIKLFCIVVIISSIIVLFTLHFAVKNG